MAGGTVQLTGDAYITQHRLDAYASHDQSHNYPLDALNTAVDELRNRYGIAE